MVHVTKTNVESVKLGKCNDTYINLKDQSKTNLLNNTNKTNGDNHQTTSNQANSTVNINNTTINSPKTNDNSPNHYVKFKINNDTINIKPSTASLVNSGNILKILKRSGIKKAMIDEAKNVTPISTEKKIEDQISQFMSYLKNNSLTISRNSYRHNNKTEI